MPSEKLNFISKSLIIWLGMYSLMYGFYFLNAVYPFDTFLFRPADRFGDFFKHTCEASSSFILYKGISRQDMVFNPILHFIGLICTKSQSIGILIVLFHIIFIFFYFINILRKIIFNKKDIHIKFLNLNNSFQFNLVLESKSKLYSFILLVIFLCINYPTIFIIDRLNTDLFGLVFLSLYLFTNNIYRFFFLAVFLSLKINYLFFILFPFFLKEKFSFILGSLMLSIAFNFIASFFFFSNIYDIPYDLFYNLKSYLNFYSSLPFYEFSHSIYNLFSIPKLVCFMNGFNCPLFSDYTNLTFNFFIILLFCYSLYFLTLNHDTLPRAIMILFLVNLFFLLNKFNPSYRLVFYLIPLFFIIRDIPFSKNFRLLFLSIIILLFPKNISFGIFGSIYHELYLSNYIDPIIQIFLFFIIIRSSYVK